MSARAAQIAELYRTRPRSAVLRVSVLAVAALVGYAWIAGSFSLGDVLSARRRANLERFLGEVSPYELRDIDWGITEFAGWCMDRMNEGGWQATALTLAIAVAAIVLAGIAGAALSFFAARTFATAAPFVDTTYSSTFRRVAWTALASTTRVALVLLRAIPEYVWTFLLVGIFGITALPAVLALAIHNAGILGKLDAETLENLRPAPLRALRGVGASRSQIALFAAFPSALARYLLYFFYRWETCIREATVLGMLGILSLGYVIGDARVRFQYDRLLFFALVGCALVVLGDLVSAAVRHLVRRAR